MHIHMYTCTGAFRTVMCPSTRCLVAATGGGGLSALSWPRNTCGGNGEWCLSGQNKGTN